MKQIGQRIMNWMLISTMLSHFHLWAIRDCELSLVKVKVEPTFMFCLCHVQSDFLLSIRNIEWGHPGQNMAEPLSHLACVDHSFLRTFTQKSERPWLFFFSIAVTSAFFTTSWWKNGISKSQMHWQVSASSPPAWSSFNSEVNSSGKWSTHPIIIHCPVQGEDKERHISSSSEGRCKKEIIIFFPNSFWSPQQWRQWTWKNPSNCADWLTWLWKPWASPLHPG